jgi:hypothetical protein
MRLPLVALALSAGCKVTDAPESLEDLMVFGFETFGDERAMQATLDELVPLADTNADDLSDGYRVSVLGADQLAAAGIEGVNVEGITGAMGEVPYTHGVADVVGIATSHDKAELFENITAYAAEDLSDRDCFLAMECESFSQVVDETAQVALLGESVRHYTHTLFWVQHDEFGDVVVIRSLSPDPIEFSTNIVQVNQQYSLAFIVPDGDAARRIEAFWVDAVVIGVDVPDSFAVDSAVNQMANQAERIDEILDGP